MELERIKRTLQDMTTKPETGQKRLLDHILLHGEHHLSQEVISYVSREMRLQTHRIAAQSLERLGDCAAILTHLKEGEILFVDEIHRFNEPVLTVFCPAMADFVLDIVIGSGSTKKNVRLHLPRFTVIAATTEIAQIQRELLSHFSVQFRLDT